MNNPSNHSIVPSTIEVFRYRVIYPGGTYVRISPNIESEKTGEILEYGTIFESTKSLYLDGVNYIKLLQPSFHFSLTSSLNPYLDSKVEGGWVFESKGGVEILQLVDVTRKQISNTNINTSITTPEKKTSLTVNTQSYHSSQVTSPSISPSNLSYSPNEQDEQIKSSSFSSKGLGFNSLSSSSSNSNSISTSPSSSAYLYSSKEKLIRISRIETKYWRDVRTMSLGCKNFKDFMELVIHLEEHGVSKDSIHSTWIPQSQREQQIKGLITLLVAVTSQCVEGVSDCTKLESSLWVLVHLGSRIANVIDFAVEAANQRYEKLALDLQRNLLHIVLEVGGRTKALGGDLAKLVDILPDDIRNFLQRWVFIKVIEPKPSIVEVISKEVVDMIFSNGEDEDGIINAPPTAFRRTPTTVQSIKKTGLSSSSLTRWSLLTASMPSCEGKIMFPNNNNTNTFSTTSSLVTTIANDSNSSTNFSHQQGMVNTDNREEQDDSMIRTRTRNGSFSNYFHDIRNRVTKFINDPNVQFANMI